MPHLYKITSVLEHPLSEFYEVSSSEVIYNYLLQRSYSLSGFSFVTESLSNVSSISQIRIVPGHIMLTGSNLPKIMVHK